MVNHEYIKNTKIKPIIYMIILIKVVTIIIIIIIIITKTKNLMKTEV